MKYYYSDFLTIKKMRKPPSALWAIQTGCGRRAREACRRPLVCTVGGSSGHYAHTSRWSSPNSLPLGPLSFLSATVAGAAGTLKVIDIESKGSLHLSFILSGRFFSGLFLKHLKGITIRDSATR